MRGPYDDVIEVLAASFTRRWRIVLWLLTGVSVGMSKAGGWMLEGVPQNVALVFATFYALNVLVLVGVVFVFITEAVPLGLRLWARRRQGQERSSRSSVRNE